MEDAAGGSHVREDDAGAVGVTRMVGQRTVTFGRDGVTGVFWKLIYYLLEDVVEGWQTPWPEPPVHDNVKVAEYRVQI
jgi:hypothetical protein